MAEQPFGLPVMLYLALAGTAAGAAVWGAVLALAANPERAVVGRRGFLIAAGAIFLGAVCLVADLESPKDWWLMLAYFNPSSWISLGTRIISLFGVITAIAWLCHARKPASARTGIRTVLACLALLGGLAVAVYPALVLRQFAARPLWNSELLVPLFVVSALHAGLAALFLVAGTQATTRSHMDGPGMRGMEMLLVLAQVGLVAAYVWQCSDLSAAAVSFLTSGRPAGFLWVGVIAVGWILPLGLATLGRNGGGLLLVRGVCVLLGVFCLRAWLLVAGQDTSMFVGAW